MRRGRKRKNVSTEEAEDIQIPSSAVLPARLRSAVSQQIQINLSAIKKEVDSLPVIKKQKTDSILLDTDKTFETTGVGDIKKITGEIQNLTSKCSEFPAVSEPIQQTTDGVNIGTNNELSFSHGSFNLQNVKSEPVSPVACAANPSFDDSNYCEQNVENLDLTKVKCEPRSRSSSTETVFNDESLKLPLAECQSDTSTKSSSAIYQVTNVAHSSSGAEESSVLSLSKETIHPSFVAPMHSPNISVSQHRNSTKQKSTSNMRFVTKLFKYNNFNTEIAKADAKDCLNNLNFLYPSNRSFSLFFSNDTFLRQRENPAVEPSKSIPIISSTPTVTEVISTDVLRKIIAFTSSLPSSNSSNLPPPLQNNSENSNIVKDAKSMNSISVPGSISHLPILCSTAEKESDHTFNPNIRIKDERLDDYDASSVISPPSVSPHLSMSDKRSAQETTTLTACRRSTGEAVSDIHQVTEINNVAELQGHSVSCVTDDRVATSKVTNMLQNNANVSHVFSDSDSKNSKGTDSIVSKSTTLKFTSYLHLLPQDILKNAPCTDKAPDTSLRTILPAEPSTSVNSNFTAVTTVSDSVITKNNINYSQNTPVINMFSTCDAQQRAFQHVQKTNLGDDRNPSDTNNPFACNKINTLNCSQPGIISSNSVTTKKKISPEAYFQRKSSIHFHDPCTQKNIGQNSVSQISSPDNSVEPIIASIASLANQQSHNHTPIAHSQDAHQYDKSTSSPKFEIASNAQQKSFQNSVSSQSIYMATSTETPQISVNSSHNQTQVIAENSSVSHHSSRKSGEFLPSTSRDPRKTHSKSYYQRLFGSRRQDFSSILCRDTAGNKFIETKDLPYIILNWNVSWLSTQKERLVCPPVWDNYLSVKDNYECIQDYYYTYQPLHLLNIWFDIYQGWEKSKVLYNGRLNEVKKEQEFVKMSCTVILNATDRSNYLKKEDILICTSSSAGSTQKCFGRIVGLRESVWNPSPDSFHFQIHGVRKQLHLEITCAESFTVQPPARVQLQNLTNIGIALKQNDALKYMNPAMRAMVLNPSENERLLQTTTVPPMTNASCMLHSVRSLQHRVTIMNTSTASISVATILQVAFLLKTDSILLVGVKDEETFLDLALKMIKLNMVLAIQEDEVPPQLRGRTVKYCDSATLKSCQVVLTLIPSMFFGEIESRLKTESIICMIHEAQCFFETETALLLAYKVEHLILTGRPDVRASTPPMLGRHSFDVSLFHRILRKR